MDLPSRTAAGKAFSNFAERETDSSSAIAADFESSCRLAMPIAPEFSSLIEEQRIAFIVGRCCRHHPHGSGGNDCIFCALVHGRTGPDAIPVFK